MTLEKIKIPALIFLISFLVYLSNLPFDYTRDLKNGRVRRLITSNDLAPNTFLPYLILKYKTIDFSHIEDALGNYFQEGTKQTYSFVVTKNKLVSAYPILTGLLAIPFYVLPIALDKIPTIAYHRDILKILLIGRVAASFYASISVVLMYLILNKISKEKVWKYIFTAFYAFGTLTWTISSRGLWQHTSSQLIVSAIVYVFLLQKEKPQLIPLNGLLCGLSVLARPTNIIIAALGTIYVFLHQKKYFKQYILYALPTVILFFGYNFLTFGNMFTEGYSARNDIGWTNPLYLGLLGFLFSPARSFLFISPPLVLSYFGIYKSLGKKQRTTNPLYVYLALSFLLYVVVASKWWAWDGGSGFGYRMLTDILPVVSLFSFLVIEKLGRKAKVIILLLIIYSILIQTNAVIFRKSRCSSDHTWSFYCLSPPKALPNY